MSSASGINVNNDWYTPEFWLKPVWDIFGKIDLDPASSIKANETVNASNIFTIGQNGLKQDWYGKVFLNPPFSSPMLSNFLKKAVKEYESGRVEEMIILTNSGTDTKWSKIITDKSTVAFTIGRISFVRPNGSSVGSTSRGQMYCYMGPNKQKFIDELLKTGKFWIPNI